MCSRTLTGTCVLLTHSAGMTTAPITSVLITTGCPSGCKGASQGPSEHTGTSSWARGQFRAFGNRGQRYVGRAIHNTDKICPPLLMSPCSPQYPWHLSLFPPQNYNRQFLWLVRSSLATALFGTKCGFNK